MYALLACGGAIETILCWKRKDAGNLNWKCVLNALLSLSVLRVVFKFSNLNSK